jgi:hypothetical protein
MSKSSTAKSLGISPKELKQREIDVSALLQEGVICQLTIGRWRATERLKSDDIGLAGIDDNFVKSFFQLGRKTLIPPEVQRAMDTVEVRSRYAFRRHAFDTPFGFFVPAQAFLKLDEEMKKFRKEWMDLRDQLVRHMKDHEQAVRQSYRLWAEQVYEHIKQKSGPKTAAGYARVLANRISDALPSRQQIHESFIFEFQVFAVPMPTVLRQDLKEKLLSDEKSKAIKEMNQRIGEKYRADNERLVGGFLRSVNNQLRSIVNDAVENVLAKSKNGKHIGGRSIFQLKKAIEQFELLNFAGEQDISKELKRLNELLATGYRKRNIGDVTGSLEKLRDMTREIALQAGSSTRKVRRERLDLGVSEIEEKSGRKIKAEQLALAAGE